MEKLLRQARIPALALIMLAAACRQSQAPVRPDAAFTPYVSAFSAGYIAANAPIRVRLADGLELADTSAAALQKLFSLKPSTSGTVTWQGARTLVFKPEERLRQDESYLVTFHLGRLAEVPDELKEFKFSVHTRQQGIDMQVSDLQALSPTNLRWQRVVLDAFTSDDATGQDLEGSVSAVQGGRKLKLTWEHEPGGTLHRLLADSVERGEAASTVEFNWNNEKIGGKGKGSLLFEVPAISDFTLLRSETTSDGDQSATLLFSDPIDPAQDLDGLVGIRGEDGVRVAAMGNKLVLYPAKRLIGEELAFVASGLQNAAGRTLGKDLSVDLTFHEVKPNVRAVGNGTILPSTDGALFPFEAVNLGAVDVQVVRIYEENVPQFLQVNSLDGGEELARVARPVLKKTVPLGTAEAGKAGQWQRYYLDLEKLVKTEPGAIYRIMIGFRQEYSTYRCTGSAPAQPLATIASDGSEDETWDTPYSYYYDGDDYNDVEDYNWRDRDNPCTPSYFRNKAVVLRRNLLASDLGLMAKRGNDGSVMVVASNLRTTEPVRGVEIRVLDLQQRTMVKTTTDGDGTAIFPPTAHTPFLIVASKGLQRGYLKLDYGSALALGNFETDGQQVDKGLKGFLYGERGVWRPGDSLYLTFILQQTANKLPRNIPVTLELSDPLGRMQQRMVRTESVEGTYGFAIATSPDAPTGAWHARVAVGGTSFYKTLRIETVKPNRLKIQMDSGGERWTASEKKQVELQVNWLHGAPAAGLTARVTANLLRATASFKGAERYNFDDLGSDLNIDEMELANVKLNAQGHASFPLVLKLNGRAPAAVKANIVTRVFEAGGDASMDRTDLTYYPYTSYAGLRMPESSTDWGSYFTDTTYTIDALAVDGNGKPGPGRKLVAHVLKLSDNWWWSGDMDEPTNYMTAPSTRVINETQLTTDASGRAQFKFKVEKPEWGRFVVRLSDPQSGHASALQLYLDWPGYAGRSRREAGTAAAMLRFNSNKTVYAPGDRCELTIPSSGTGRALVSLENGTRVLESHWVELKEKETKFSFTITETMTPNIYAQVMLVQPHAATAPYGDEGTPGGNDLPIRMYGVLPIMVENPTTRLEPVITSAPAFKTDEAFTVEMAEKTGKAMTYTLAIVDEGLLDLTRFRTPDPWGHFYAKEALGVRTWDVYDQVIGAFGQRLRRVLALGGSDQADPAEAAKAQRFKPVVRFVGPFHLAKGKKASHRFTVSNYVGSVRIMAVANTAEGAYGHAEKAVPVRKPLMVLATLPRVAGPGETMDLPVTVFAMDPKVKEVRVSLAANELFVNEDDRVKNIRFAGTGEQVVTFRVKVKEALGIGKVTVTAEGAGEKSSQHIELDVRRGNQPETDVVEAVIEPGQTWDAAPAPLGIDGTNNAYLELSTMPPVDLGRRLQYLIDYPHGCLEQTTSRAFPQLYIAEVMEVNAAMADAMRQNVRAGLDRLKQFQTPGGGFGYWPGDRDPDDWTTTYGGHFMVEAERKGFAPPAGVKEGWLAYTRRQARDWTPDTRNNWGRASSQMAQAYRLYVLALNNTTETGAMNRLRTTPQLATNAAWMLAAAYALNNRKDVANEMTRDLSTSVPAYRELAWTYGSDLRDQAVIAEALMQAGDRTKAAPVVREIGARLSSGEWLSTQTTAWAMLAISRFAVGNPLDKTMHFTSVVKGKTDNRVSDRSIVRMDLPVPDGRQRTSISNTGKNLIYLRLVRNGIPAAGEETPASSGLAMTVEYRNMTGAALDPARLGQGTDFQAIVSVHNTGTRGTYRELALTQVFPSGWEIRNSRLEETENVQQNSPFNYQDIRDDRVMTYFDLGPGETATYRVLLNAAYTGNFHLPATQCSAMYDNTIYARGRGQWVQVVKPGEATAMQ